MSICKADCGYLAPIKVGSETSILANNHAGAF